MSDWMFWLIVVLYFVMIAIINGVLNVIWGDDEEGTNVLIAVFWPIVIPGWLIFKLFELISRIGEYIGKLIFEREKKPRSRVSWKRNNRGVRD